VSVEGVASLLVRGRGGMGVVCLELGRGLSRGVMAREYSMVMLLFFMKYSL